MNLLSPKIIKEILSRYSAVPSKRFGQNFLINPGVLKKIIDAAALDRGGTVLEIGPGVGTLTQELARHAKKVIAIEKDRKMVEILKQTLKEYKNVEIIEADALRFQVSGFKFHDYKVVANLPYYIASPAIRKFLESANKPSGMILMLQKEVAQKICASPPDMSLLAVSVQFYAEPEIISYVSKGSFWPSPKVDSAIIKIVPHKRIATPSVDAFFTVVKAGFSAPRKQLINNLSKKLKVERQIILSAVKKAKIKPEQRAETLNIGDWLFLAKILELYL